MNPRSFFIGLKNKLAPRLAVETIWKAELVLAGLILAGMLALDFWIYNQFVGQKNAEALTPQIAVIIKKNALEKAAENIKNQNQFIENPSFQFVQSPF